MENVLGSKAKIRILKVLIDKEELNITAIAREAEINHKTALRHLEELKKTGIITERVFGRVRVFRINSKDPRVETLKMLFKSLGEKA
ncbi:MAG: ArsR family transcriptional regulator [Thermoprotei archaeon]|nr:MAG: ArsR family transcriptional regulator [Thermoprotei archaeon]